MLMPFKLNVAAVTKPPTLRLKVALASHAADAGVAHSGHSVHPDARRTRCCPHPFQVQTRCRSVRDLGARGKLGHTAYCLADRADMLFVHYIERSTTCGVYMPCAVLVLAPPWTASASSSRIRCSRWSSSTCWSSSYILW